MNDHYQNREFCHYHPHQILVGACPFCLNEKLLAVAAKRSRHQNHRQTSHSRKPSNGSLPKIFAFGSLLTRRRRHNHQETFHDCYEDGGCSDGQSTSTSLEDSFISIKFEDNGIALWDKSEVTKASQDQQLPNKPLNASRTNHSYMSLLKQSSWKKSSSHKSVVEHSKTAPRGSLRWRKRIGHLLQLVKWENRPNNKHNGGAGGAVSVSTEGWLRRTLTRRRTCKE